GPILVLSIFTGVLADRVSRRTLLLVTQSTQCVLALTLGALAWSGHARYGHVLVVAVIWGIMSSIDQPARPSLAGILIARVGLSLGFFLNAIAFVFAIAMLVAIPARRPIPRIAGRTFA